MLNFDENKQNKTRNDYMENEARRKNTKSREDKNEFCYGSVTVVQSLFRCSHQLDSVHCCVRIEINKSRKYFSSVFFLLHVVVVV